MTTFIIILLCSLIVALSFCRRRQKANFEKELRELCYSRFHLEKGDIDIVTPLYDYIINHSGNKKEVSELAFAYYCKTDYNIEDLDKVINFVLKGSPTYQELLQSDLERFHKWSQEAISWEQTKHHQKDS